MYNSEKYATDLESLTEIWGCLKNFSEAFLGCKPLLAKDEFQEIRDQAEKSQDAAADQLSTEVKKLTREAHKELGIIETENGTYITPTFNPFE